MNLIHYLVVSQLVLILFFLLELCRLDLYISCNCY
jgi:hypothetical protein